MVRQLQPWIANLKKRQVKSPKVYFRGSGIFHYLMGIPDEVSLKNHPKLGASWEGMALEEIIRYHQADSDECYFWSVHSGSELDLLIIKDGKKLGFEFKYTDSPKLTKSMRISKDDLQLDRLNVICPNIKEFPLSSGVRVISLEGYLSK